MFNDVKWNSSFAAKNTQNKIWWHGAQGRQLESQFQAQILPPLLAILKGIWKTRLNVIQNLMNSNEGSLGCSVVRAQTFDMGVPHFESRHLHPTIIFQKQVKWKNEIKKRLGLAHIFLKNVYSWGCY